MQKPVLHSRIQSRIRSSCAIALLAKIAHMNRFTALAAKRRSAIVHLHSYGRDTIVIFLADRERPNRPHKLTKTAVRWPGGAPPRAVRTARAPHARRTTT